MKSPPIGTRTKKETLRKWMGVVRWTYNNLVDLISTKSKDDKITKKYLRSKFLNADVIPNWAKKVPYDVRDHATDQVLTAYKTNVKKTMKTKKGFKLRFRSRKNGDVLVLRSKYYRFSKDKPFEFNWFPRTWFDGPIKSYEKLPDTIHDSIIIRDKLNNYYLCLLSEYDEQADINHKKRKVISLDPGIRTFQTGYDPDGRVFDFGNNFGVIATRLHFLDKLRAKIDTCKKKRSKYQMRKAFLRASSKISLIIKDFHCKLAKWLCERYENVVIPVFQTKQIAINKIGRKNKRKLYVWSHYSFRKRLIEKARFYNCKIHVVTEEYTSKTCGSCGKINNRLGSKKEFQCRCSLKIDRDYNGARNILIKMLA